LRTDSIDARRKSWSPEKVWKTPSSKPRTSVSHDLSIEHLSGRTVLTLGKMGLSSIAEALRAKSKAEAVAV
jgi:hypothetical protein